MCTSTIKNLTRDGLGLTSDRVTHRRILLEEYAPGIIYVKEGIHNTVAYAISWLDYDPKLNSTNEDNHATHVMSTKEEGCQKGLMFSKFWSCYNKTQDPVETYTIQMNHVFTNCSEEDEIYPLTVKEIVEAQKADTTLKHFFNSFTTSGTYMRQLINQASWSLNNISIYCPLATFDS